MLRGSNRTLMGDVLALWRYFAVEGTLARQFMRALASQGVPFTVNWETMTIVVGDVPVPGIADANPDEESTTVPDTDEGSA